MLVAWVCRPVLLVKHPLSSTVLSQRGVELMSPSQGERVINIYHFRMNTRNTKFDSALSAAFQLLRNLVSLGERQGRQEQRAARQILDGLRRAGIPASVQYFKTAVPTFLEARLRADTRTIPAFPTSFVSGTINGSSGLVSSLLSSQPLIRTSNINFNPVCAGISRSNHYFAPALAISKSDLPALLNARRVNGRVRVRKYSFRSANIIVGNQRDPSTVIFCHYDSLGPGAVDNASGVATIAGLCFRYPEVLQRTLLVFAGNEELSYDFPVYWGRGYREFELRNMGVMANAKHIIVIDCVGNGKTVVSRDRTILQLAFPVISFDPLASKLVTLFGDLANLQSVYHSDLDTLDMVKPKWIDDAIETSRRLID